MIKRFLTLIGIASAILTYRANADEGMWLPIFVERLNYTDMEKMGLRLTADEIYSINHSSLKDAIVQFGGGCTAELISPSGLLITNHHCGYGSIQSLSSVEHDYLKDGFWARSMEEELKCEGLTAKFLIRIEDVSPKILSEMNDTMSEASRSKKIHEVSSRIEEEAVKGTKYEAKVNSFFNGNEFYLFVFEIFRDIRLVGTPPESLGKFGGDTDNWMWPRHTCDFSMFRVYTSPDGSPADYSKENLPLVSKHYLPVSIKGVKTEDFTMVMGYPGTTDRYLTSFGVKMAIEKTNPSYVSVRDKKLAIMKEDMNSDEGIRIKYAAKYAGTSNYWKFFIGQTKGLKRLRVYDKKVELEKNFSEWISRDQQRNAKYGDVLKDLSEAYKSISNYAVARIYFSEALIRGNEIIAFSHNFEELYRLLSKEKGNKSRINAEAESLKLSAEKYFKDYNSSTDRKLLEAMLTLYCNDIPKEQQPEVISDISEKYDNNFGDYAEKVFSKSIFADRNKVIEFLNNPGKKALEKDMIFPLMQKLYDYYTDLNRKISPFQELADRGNRLFVKGIMEMQPEKKFYPNANSTMRLSYGKVLDYYPQDAVHYDYVTTLKGVMEKEDPTNDEFIVPEKLKELWEAKDFGRYGSGENLVTCFLTTNDITGGNSGSPVINREGQLLGLAFDGNWEAMSSNIAYEPELQRTICVDIRYVLFIIDKFAGAGNLIKEMNIVTTETSAPQKTGSGLRINSAKDNPTGTSPTEIMRNEKDATLKSTRDLKPGNLQQLQLIK